MRKIENHSFNAFLFLSTRFDVLSILSLGTDFDIDPATFIIK